MRQTEAENQNDPALLPFLSAEGEAQAEACLCELILAQTESTVKGILRSKLRVSLSRNDQSHSNQEALDLLTEVQATLVTTLRELKTNSQKPIRNFHGYVATVTFNACHYLLRKKYPKRWQLKNKLRYILTHEPNFAVWQNKERDWLCGLASWPQANLEASSGQHLQSLRELCGHLSPVWTAQSRQRFSEWLNSAFLALKAPILLDELVSVLTDWLQLREDTTTEIDVVEKSLSSQMPSTGPLNELEQRAQLQTLWTEICGLPLRHRVALLLNLKDRQGADTLALFPLTRVATIRQIAAVLDLSPEKFASMWNDLPWDDAAIAQHLSLTRQQVINLRHSARARLARRLKLR